jgi:hypothetical protein
VVQDCPSYAAVRTKVGSTDAKICEEKAMANPKPLGDVRKEFVPQLEDIGRRIQESIDAIARLLISLNGAGFLAVPTISGILHIDTRANRLSFLLLLFGLFFFALGSILAGSVFVRMLLGLISERRRLEIEIEQRRLEPEGSYKEDRLKELDLVRLGLGAKVEATNVMQLALLGASALTFVLGVIIAVGLTMSAQ